MRVQINIWNTKIMFDIISIISLIIVFIGGFIYIYGFNKFDKTIKLSNLGIIIALIGTIMFGIVQGCK